MENYPLIIIRYPTHLFLCCSSTSLSFSAANGEIQDLRIIMNSADKELKEYKDKVKAREAEMMGLESKVF